MHKLTLKYLIFFLLVTITNSSCEKYPLENRKKIDKNELILKNFSEQSVHAATIVEATNGDILVAFFGGSGERNPDCSIWLSRLSGGKWSKAQLIADGMTDGEKIACWNPVLFRVPNGDLILCYKVGKSITEWVGYIIKSSDNGFTWSKPKELDNGCIGPSKNKPIIIGDRILYGSSTETPDWNVHFESSDLNGEDWRVENFIPNRSNHSIIQPTFLIHKDGKIQVLCRNKNTWGNIITSFSTDKGKTWSEAERTNIPSNNSGIDVVTLKDGSFLLVYNHSSGDNTGYAPRSPIIADISYDGINWKHFIFLEAIFLKELSYPSVIQASDGKIHIVYSWKRKNIKHISLTL